MRRRLEGQDSEALYRRLSQADPAGAQALDPRNVRRVVRAVEILELTGRPPSELRTGWERGGGPYALCVAGLSWERDALLARSIERVERELDAGVVDEVRRALARGISRTASQALGVKEIVEHIEGRLTLAEATEVQMRNTKGFVRRQLSWFGTDPRVEWVGVSALGWEGARDRIVRRFSGVLAGDQ